ncbi:MAG: hypothetical protein HQL20_02080 [Candidatus Omnitrophica bacterium]|nr:hypothetical protein [Candidatus Omnitrophota bacterium]
MLDETSAIKAKITYTAWGEIKSYDKYGDEPEVARFYFTGKKLDDETGLYYFGARYYNPRIARFITPDTIVQSPFNPQTLNRYAYCNNNPINLVDPTGHSYLDKIGRKIEHFFTEGPGSSILQVMGVVLAPVTGGASLYLTYAGMAISGYTAYQAGSAQFNAWMIGSAVGLVTGGMVNSSLGSSIAGFYGGGLLGSTLAGATMGGLSGAIAGGITAGVLGGNWAQGARMGGISGLAVGGAAGFASAAHARTWYGMEESVYEDGRTGRWSGDEGRANFSTIKNDPNIRLVRNPSFANLENALKAGYTDVILSTHGTTDGLLFSDGWHNLSELGGSSSSINAKNLVVGSCWPQHQEISWNSLGATNTNYINIGAQAYGPHYSRAPIESVNGGKIDSQIYTYIYGK